MIKIANNSISEISIGSTLGVLDKKVLESNNLYAEFSGGKIISLSFRNETEFYFYDEKIKSKDIEQFIERKKFIFFEDLYVLPNENIALFYEKNDEGIFYELTVFDDSIKENYIANNSVIEDYHQGNFNEPIWEFVPYKSLIGLEFGQNKDEIIAKLGVPMHSSVGVRGKELLDYKNIFFRFDGSELTQFHLDLLEDPLQSTSKPTEILINGYNLLDKIDFKNLKKEYKFIKRKSQLVFEDLGVVVNEGDKLESFYFFDESLLKFWKNIHRPITSW